MKAIDSDVPCVMLFGILIGFMIGIFVGTTIQQAFTISMLKQNIEKMEAAE